MKLSNFIQRAWRYFTTPEMILYIIFGVLTTVINVVVCGVFYYNLHWNILAANAFAWILSVAFAFITNKLYVFRSKSFAAEIFVRELVEFVAARRKDPCERRRCHYQLRIKQTCNFQEKIKEAERSQRSQQEEQ